jgi:hypothetical protein
VLAPVWWHKHTGMSFDEDFFFHPQRRVEAEQKMEHVLYDRWGEYGLGANRHDTLPVIGAVHLAAGFLISEMMGCRVEYKDSDPPQVIPAHRESLKADPGEAFKSTSFQRFQSMVEHLESKYNKVVGDVNWGGILNIALDLRGESLFMDMYDRPEDVKTYFSQIHQIIERFTGYIASRTGTTSISVNRTVAQFREPVFLHSECTNTMISASDYERFLLSLDSTWSLEHRPFGIHHCGPDAHRFAEVYGRVPHLDFLDVGWGSDIKTLRQNLPHTFLNIRLSPVEIVKQNEDQIHYAICKGVEDSGNPRLTGLCCINMDDRVTDLKIATIFETVQELRNKYKAD